MQEYKCLMKGFEDYEVYENAIPGYDGIVISGDSKRMLIHDNSQTFIANGHIEEIK